MIGRLIGSIRRECLDHLVIFHERHLQGILARYFAYYHRWRTNLSLAMVLHVQDVFENHSYDVKAVLPNRIYVVSEEAAKKLRDAGVQFTELSRESNIPSLEGVGSGERI